MGSISWGGTFFVLSLFVTCYIGTLFTVWPSFLLLFPWAYGVHRAVCDISGWSWMVFCTALYERLYGVRIVLAGDFDPRDKRPSLIISNHRTRFDWMFLWSYFLRTGTLHHEKIILKAGLKNLPGFGWAMQGLAFIFLRRRWEDDEATISNMLDHYKDIQFPVQLQIFPEGTDLSPSNKEKGHAFAKKSGGQLYEHVLPPRVKGFQHIVTAMRNDISSVIDITMGYPDVVPQNESDLLAGRFPHEIHFHVKRYDITSLPDTDAGLAKWCTDRWAEKEQLLADFHHNKQFPGTLEAANAQGILWIQLASFLYWVLLLPVVFIALWFSSYVFAFFLAGNLFFMVASYLGGADRLALWRTKFIKRKSL